MRARQGRQPSPCFDQRGQNAVEFALLLPVLLLIFLGVADFGRIMHAAITVTNAAREGARYAARYQDDWGSIPAVVISEAAGSGLDLSTDTDIIVSCPDAPGASPCPRGTPVRVEVTHAFQLFTTAIIAGAEVPVFSYAELMVP